jgi:glycosyltransferase involved in cell wall biosynthesis
MRLVAFLPAWNEEQHLPYVLESMLAQTVPFHEIIVIDDASEDDTRRVAQSYGVTVLALTKPHKRYTGKTEIALTYNHVFDYLDMVGTDYDFLVQHAADTLLPQNYNERLLEKFKANPNLVIASGQIRGEHTVKNHARGSGRFYKAWFWNQYVQRFPLVYLWEDYAVWKALSLGYEVTTFPELEMVSLRPTYNDKHQYGWAMRELGFDPLYALLCCLKAFREKPRRGLMMLYTYLTSPNGCYDPHIRRFLRRQQSLPERLKCKLAA